MDIRFNVERKRLMATVYLDKGLAVKSATDLSYLGNAIDLVKLYNDSGVDKLLIMDVSDTEEGHRKSLKTIREINRILEINSYAYGWTSSIQDIRDYFFAGCRRVVLDTKNPELNDILEDCSKHFRNDRLSLAVNSVDILFKKKDLIDSTFHDLYIFDKDLLSSISAMTNMPFYMFVDSENQEDYEKVLLESNCLGAFGPMINDQTTDIMFLKNDLFSKGILTQINTSTMDWSCFNLNHDGLISVITQDYSTKEVLDHGYMNEEAFNLTLQKGKMHYYDTDTNEVYMHGFETKECQYIKSLSVDCDHRSLLAKVSQIGNACSTGNHSCFFNEILKTEYMEKNTVKILENIYNVIHERKHHPREGSFTNELLDAGLNEISKRLLNEATNIVLSAKDNDAQALSGEISDLIFFIMVLMTEYELNWDDISNELTQRK